MTVSTSSNSVTVGGNGVQTVFGFGFIGASPSYISVIYTDLNGNQTTLAVNQFQVALNAAAPGQLWGVGGTVTYPLSGSPIATGASLTITRTVPQQQNVTIQNQGDAFPQVIETGLDLLEMQIQQGSALANRAFVANPADASAPAPVPPVAQRASSQAMFDASGNLTAGQPINNTTVSAAMIPVVTASTLAAARSALGVSVPTAPTNGLAGTGVNIALSWNSNTKVNFSCSEVTAETALGAVAYKSAALALTCDFTVIGAGGLDTGTIGNSTFYALYAIFNPNSSTWAVLAVAAVTSSGAVYGGANMPAGYTASGLVGFVLTDGSAHIRVFQIIGREHFFQSFIVVFTAHTSPNNTNLNSQSISSAVPTAALSVSGLIGFSSNQGSHVMGVAADASGTGLQLGEENNVNITVAGFNDVALNFRGAPIITSQTLFWQVDSANVPNCRLIVTSFTF